MKIKAAIWNGQNFNPNGLLLFYMHSSKLSLAVDIKCTRSWYYFTIFVKGDINEFICSQIKKFVTYTIICSYVHSLK